MHTIALFSQSAQLSGAELFLARIAAGFNRVNPIVILGEDGPLRSIVEASGIKTFVLPGGTLGSVAGRLRCCRHLAALLRSSGAAVLYTHSAKAHVLGGIAGRLARIPVVFHAHDLLGPPARGLLGSAFMRFCFAMLPNRRFANSTLTRASAGTVARRQWSVFPCPVPDELLAEPCVSAENAANYRRARLLVLGRITAWKGQEIALRALEHLVDAGHDVELHIVGSPQFPGDGKYELRLHALAANPKIAARVHFRGHSEDPASALRDADIALHTSLRPEPFGQVIVEAMAAGTPIVAASNAGAIEWLTPGSDCTTYTMGDARGLARQVSHLLAQPDEARRIAKNARLTAESLSVKEIGPRIENELIVAAGPSA